MLRCKFDLRMIYRFLRASWGIAVIHQDQLDLAKAEAIRAHQQRFACQPKWIGAAPGRANLVGEHIDYNDGFVLPLAINRYTTVAASLAHPSNQDSPERSSVHTFAFDQTANINHGPTQAPGHPSWLNYVKGVWHGFGNLGFDMPCLNITVQSTVPVGGGLSSSAALEVATATMLEAVVGQTLDPIDKIKLCRKAEHEFAGVPCGIMDQFIAVFGKPDHLLLLDCRSQKTEQIPFDSNNAAVILVDSGVQHELARSQYSLRRQQCEMACQALNVKSLRDVNLEQLESNCPQMDDVVYRRARHVVNEIRRTCQCANALRVGDWQLAGQLMFESHRSLQQDYEVSCGELDALVSLAQNTGVENGVYGARMTGGGFGGYVIMLVKKNSAEKVIHLIGTEYKKMTGSLPSIFSTAPGMGATMLH